MIKFDLTKNNNESHMEDKSISQHLCYSLFCRSVAPQSLICWRIYGGFKWLIDLASLI